MSAAAPARLPRVTSPPPRTGPSGGPAVLRVAAPFDAVRVRAAVERAVALLGAQPALLQVEVDGTEGTSGDLGTVDLLARLRLLCNRAGVALEVRGDDRAALAALLALAGLTEVLAPALGPGPAPAPAPGPPGGQA